ncbi:MAG: HepT-like ribonuclease domain-containing protein [Planctomycetota bacterium]
MPFWEWPKLSMAPELAWLTDIATAARRIVRFVHGVDFPGFMSNEEKQYAVYGQIIIIGEASNRLSQEFKESHSVIPWRKIIGMCFRRSNL